MRDPANVAVIYYSATGTIYEDRGWLGTEAADAALQARGEAWAEGQGPDEALCRLWEAPRGWT